MKVTIPVVLICDDNFVMQTCVTITSLLGSAAPDTTYDLFVVMAECSDASKARLAGYPHMHIVEADLTEYRDIKQLAHIPIACLLKFNICELVPQYDKLLYLDGDILVRGDLQPLYATDLTGYYAGAVSSMMPKVPEKVNCGMMLFNAKRMRDEGMRQKLVATRRSLGDRGSMDQQTFNQLCGSEILRLPQKYNCIPYWVERTLEQYPLDKINTLYDSSYTTPEEIVRDAVIIHFATNDKPWRVSYGQCVEEWYQCYLQSPYKNEPLQRLNRRQARAAKWKKQLEEKGLGGVLAAAWLQAKKRLTRRHARPDEWV